MSTRRPFGSIESAESGEAEFRQALGRGASIPDDEWTAFRRRLHAEQFPKKAILVQAGEPVDRVWYLLRGIVRYFDATVTYGFDWEGRFVSDAEGFFFGAGAARSVEALEDVHALAIPREILEQSYDRHPCWERVGRLRALDVLRRRFDKERRIRSQSAQERYQELVRKGSPLIDRVPQYHLAAYLGIAPETLSRIRART